MPAQRSRTSGWRRCLQQLVDHKGSLQIALAPNGEAGHDFIWRAKLISTTENEIFVEMPTAAGEPLPLEKGVQLLGIIAIGQNRWMFRTECLGSKSLRSYSKEGIGLKLQMPAAVERSNGGVIIESAQIRLRCQLYHRGHYLIHGRSCCQNACARCGWNDLSTAIVRQVQCKKTIACQMLVLHSMQQL